MEGFELTAKFSPSNFRLFSRRRRRHLLGSRGTNRRHAWLRPAAMSYFLISIFCLLVAAGGVRAQSPGTYTDLHDFNGTATDANGSTGPDGADPREIAFDSAGNMYGTTIYGGANGGTNGSNVVGGGTVWEITASGAYRDLHDFGGTVINANGTSGLDGAQPFAITLDSAGNIYGTANVGGPNFDDLIDGVDLGAGMVWEITANGTYKDLHDFGGTIVHANGTSGADGEDPAGDVTFDRVGNMYGTTFLGGYGPENGMLWEITTSGTYKDLHDFGGPVANSNGAISGDGIEPLAGVTFDTAGNMYGTTYRGGANEAGIVWEIMSAGNYEDLHDFGGTVTNAGGTIGQDGYYPNASVTFDNAGNMYGTTTIGGSDGLGVGGIVWEITASGTYEVLHDFGGTVTDSDGTSGPDGSAPDAAVAFDAAGNMFGTASGGGANGDDGMVWEIPASGTYKDLHDFGGTVTNVDGSAGPDGFAPTMVIFDKAGNLLGPAAFGGPYPRAAIPLDYGGILWELVPPAPAPATPILTAAAATGGVAPISLSWNAVSGAVVYRVYRSTVSNGEANPALAGGLANPGYTDTSALTAGSTYYYKVTAVNANGASPFSNEAAATLTAAPPTGLTATASAGGFNPVTLAWTASTGATGYDVYRGSSLIGSSATTGFSHSGAAAGVANSYTVTAVNAGGTSAASNTATVTLSPVTPAALTATAGDNKVILNWSASSGALVYRVFRSTTFGGEANPAFAAGLVTPTYTDTAAMNGTTYYYKVTAVNTGGASAFSAQVSATAGSGAPLAPTLETVTTAAGGSAPITLTWSASAGALVYRVFRSTAAGAEANPALAAGISIAAYADTSALTAGVTYYYKVTAVNTGGASPFSNEQWATLAPSPPANLTATATAGAAPVTLNWTAASGATGYYVYRGTSQIGSTASPTFSDTAVVAAGIGVSYTVTAVNAGGTSGASAAVSTVLHPAAPAGLTATAGNNKVILNWSVSPGMIVYRVYRSTMSGGEANPALAGGLGSATYTDTATVNGVAYYYEVTAVNTAGASPFSGEAGPATPSSTAPASPTLLTASAAVGGVGPITLTWTSSGGTLVYRVYRSTSSGGEMNPAFAAGITTTAYTDSSALTAGITYYYKVTAVNTEGASAFSNELGVLLSPATPTGLSATAVAGPAVDLAWNASAGATSYNVYRGTVPGVETLLTSTSGPSYVDAGAVSGTTYYYKVTAVNAGGASARSNEVQVFTE
jgi:fibronectin type 3 domain-containing protein